MSAKTLYFAYGSNLWLRQMGERCPGTQYIGIALLSGWRWIISARGCANIVRSPTDHVYGFLYTLTPDDERYLDGREGPHYVKQQMSLEFRGLENSASALAYVDFLNTTEGGIRDEYIRRMNYAIRDALEKGIPAEYIDKYLRPSVPATSIEEQ